MKLELGNERGKNNCSPPLQTAPAVWRRGKYQLPPGNWYWGGLIIIYKRPPLNPLQRRGLIIVCFVTPPLEGCFSASWNGEVCFEDSQRHSNLISGWCNHIAECIFKLYVSSKLSHISIHNIPVKNRIDAFPTRVMQSKPLLWRGVSAQAETGRSVARILVDAETDIGVV